MEVTYTRDFTNDYITKKVPVLDKDGKPVLDYRGRPKYEKVKALTSSVCVWWWGDQHVQYKK